MYSVMSNISREDKDIITFSFSNMGQFYLFLKLILVHWNKNHNNMRNYSRKTIYIYKYNTNIKKL